MRRKKGEKERVGFPSDPKREKEESLVKEIDSLQLNVPDEVMDRIDKVLEESKAREKITMGGLSKDLMSLAPEYQGKMRLSIFLACLGELFGFAVYFFSAYAAGWLIKRAGGEDLPFSDLLTCALFAMASLALYFALTGFSTILSHKTSFAILAKLRQTLFEKLQKIPLGYLIDHPVGKLKVVIMDRVGDMEDWVAHTMPELPSRMLHPLLCSAILFYLDWRIGLSVFAPLPIVMVGMAIMMYKYRSRMAIWLSSYANVAERSAEYIRGIPVIKAFVQDQASYGKFADAVKFYHFSTMKWWEQSWLGQALMMAAFMTPPTCQSAPGFFLVRTGSNHHRNLPPCLGPAHLHTAPGLHHHDEF